MTLWVSFNIGLSFKIFVNRASGVILGNAKTNPLSHVKLVSGLLIYHGNILSLNYKKNVFCCFLL